MSRDRIEFWLEGGGGFPTVDSSFAPDRGEVVNIQSKNYEVVGRTFSYDYSADVRRSVTCVLTLRPSIKPIPRVGK